VGGVLARDYECGRGKDGQASWWCVVDPIVVAAMVGLYRVGSVCRSLSGSRDVEAWQQSILWFTRDQAERCSDISIINFIRVMN